MKKLLITTLVILLTLFVGYIFLLSDYNPMLKNDEFVNLRGTLEIAKKDNLSSVDNLYNKIHKADEKNICPCDIITNNVDPFRHQISPKNKIYSAKIKSDFTTNDCLKQYLLYSVYLHGEIGIKSASEYYFHKPLEELTEKEKITLLVMLENPALYNPERRKEKIEKKVKSYQEILSKQNGR